MSRTVFQLNVTQILSVCHFELRGEGHTITVNLDYPLSLTSSYEQWQSAYLDYYRQLRGRQVINGSGSTPVDRDKQLVNAETQLLNEFHRWLLSPELVSIRREIAKATSNRSESENHWVEVFLTCTPIKLERLPWETWEIGMDLGTPEKIRIARTPATILNEPVRPLHRKARILAILGDDTGLNFEGDQQAVRSLNRVVEVEFVDCKPEVGTDAPDAKALKIKIVQAIADERGWDVLFFAGHSNETVLTGGELGIAPNVSLSIWEISEALKQAKERGLQFAIFNSCSGINIAESLINLGLSQVVVMREPIHNQVAQEFLKQFLLSLAQYKDVHSAMLDASHYLKQQANRISYPSAYLVPSLFRHPNAELFRIKPFGFWSTAKQWLPTQKEAKWLGIFLFASLLLQLVPNLLLEPRILLQAIYRQVTFQVPNQVETPLLLVQIDERSLSADQNRIKHHIPLDYGYLARLIQKLSKLNADLIGIDYILDEYNPLTKRFEEQPYTELLRKSLQDGNAKGIQFVFGYYETQNSKLGRVSDDIASFSGRKEGDITFYEWTVALPHVNLDDCSVSYLDCPFSYNLALTYLQQNKKIFSRNLFQFDLDNQSNFRQQLINLKNPQSEQLNFLKELRLHPISNWSGWFHPIIDFSIPPERAYESISACELLGTCTGKRKLSDNLKNRIVLIIPGGYEAAGVHGTGDDNFAIPLAVAFWHGERGWSNLLEGKSTFSGGEAHAYMLHHLLTRRLVVPIPDFLMILLFSLLGKGASLILLDNPSKRQRWLIGLGGITTAYVIVSLQIYISAAVLMPWFLPLGAFWNHVRLVLRRKSYE